MTNKQQVNISKFDALNRLSSYSEDVEKIYEDIRKLDLINDKEKRKIILNEIKEKYRSIKENLKAEWNQLEKYETVGVVSKFYLPALRDMLHNSTLLPVNQVAFKNIDKLQHSLYDIKDYAEYWINQLEQYKI
ncbi:hypothetical protein [Priestia filamentosa]|uniref:hypothetical protein n=1 Tax=Priestia filamentosa TaxID=1402861 RepID=UPI000A083910|nr:hypothetical protein [Priestia filamentosa]OXS69849.1 hypothetical protein B1B01_12930 [Priestia filamentosa]SMF37151.1 hypothetical protein SAMN06296056_1021166 [Priestia filamentosa]